MLLAGVSTQQFTKCGISSSFKSHILTRSHTHTHTHTHTRRYAHLSWDVMDQSYKPPVFTDPNCPVASSDPDIFTEAAVLRFNDIDPLAGVDRRSAEVRC